MMKYLFISLICLALGWNLMAQPASDAVFEKITKEYVLNDDGSIDLHYYKKLKLLTHYSFNRLYGETFIAYNPQHQALKINKAIVTQKDGNVVESPVNAFNEILPQFAADAPAYNHLREMVVTHSGTAIDAVIELDYTLHTDKGYYPGFMSDEILTTTSPVNEEIITLTVPKNRTLNYKVLNIRTAPQITETSSGKVYKFSFGGIKEDTHESNQPADNSHLPRLLFSTLDWKEAQKFLTDQPGFSFIADESMKAAVAKIKKECKDDLSLVLKIQEWVANDINTYPIPGEYTGFTGRTSAEVWKSNGGTPVEKCLLMTTLMRAAGINAEPLAVIPTGIYDDAVGCLNLVSNYLVQVNPRELEQMILSPVEYGSQNMIYSLNGRTTLVLNSKKPMKIAVNEKFENKAIMNADFAANDSMVLSGKADLALFERTNPYYKLKSDSSYARQMLSGGLSAGDIKSFKIVNAAQTRSNMNFEIKKSEPMKAEANYRFFSFPEISRGTAGWHISYLTAERKTPLEIPYPVNEQYSFTIDVPAGVTLVNPVELTEMKTSFGEMVLSVVQKENKITVKKMLVITSSVIAVSEYGDFKRMIDMWNDRKCRELILKK
jgi:hypothetical protein